MEIIGCVCVCMNVCMHGGMRKTYNEYVHIQEERMIKVGSAQYADGMCSCATRSSLLHCMNLSLPMPSHARPHNLMQTFVLLHCAVYVYVHIYI